MNPATLEREFTLHSMRWHLMDMPRSLLEQQFLLTMEHYLELRDLLWELEERIGNGHN